MRSQRSGTSKRHNKIAKPPRCGGPFIGSAPVKAGVADWAGNKNSSVPLVVGNCATCRARAKGKIPPLYSEAAAQSGELGW